MEIVWPRLRVNFWTRTADDCYYYDYKSGVKYATRNDDTMTKIVFSPSEDDILVQEMQNDPITYDSIIINYENKYRPKLINIL